MGFRETLEQKRGVGIGIAVVLAIGAGWLIVHETSGRQGTPPGPHGTQYWFTTDDGKTTFADDAQKLPPFDHNGKQAVRACCFTSDDGNTHWIAYLERFSPNGKRVLEAYLRRPIEDQDGMERTRLMSAGIEVKRPGAPETDWTTMANVAKYHEITQLKDPNGKSGVINPYLP